MLANVQARSGRATGAARRADRAAARRWREVRLRGLMGGVELAPPAEGLRWGRRGLRGGGRARRAAAPARRRGRPDAAADHHRAGARADRRRPGRGDRGADREVSAREVADAAGASAWIGARRRAGESGRRRSATAIREAGQWRVIRDLDAAGPEGKLAPERHSAVVSFASNDYLGLAAAPAGASRPRAAALDRWGAGAGAARLIVGSRPVHAELEAELASWKGAERGAALPDRLRRQPRRARDVRRARRCSSAPTSSTTRRSSTAAGSPGREVAVYPPRAISTHLDCAAARRGRPALVVSDTVFSMDGDSRRSTSWPTCAPRHGALLVLDEAHAVLGPHPELAGVEALRVGTLSKTLGAARRVRRRAAAADRAPAQPRPLVHLHHRSTPADAAAALAALTDRPLGGGRGAPRAPARPRRAAAPGHPSPIMPVVIGEPRARSPRPRRCSSRAFWCRRSVRPPCPPGSSRLRVALSAAHTDDQVAGLAAALAEIPPS